MCDMYVLYSVSRAGCIWPAPHSLSPVFKHIPALLMSETLAEECWAHKQHFFLTLETWLTPFSLPLPVESKQTPTPGWNDEQTPLRTGELHKQQQLSLPIRFALSHSFCVTSKHVLLHKETQDFTNIHAPSLFPIYRYYWVGVMFFILGLGTLLPWNFFMTASLVKTRPHKIWHNMKHMLGFQW